MTKQEARSFVLIAAVFVISVTMLHGGIWKIDTTAIYYAARSWGAGMPELLYPDGALTIFVEPPAEWRAWADAEGWGEDAFFTPYLYPPLWAALLAPVATHVSAMAFFNGALLISALATAWMVWLSWSASRPARIAPPLFALLGFAMALASAAGYLTFWLGQVQPLVAAVTLAAALALMNGRDVTAGGLLALAAAAKLSPALLVILFVMERRWRALAAFAVVGAALGLASLALAGWPLHAQLLAKLGEIDAHVLLSRILVSLELVLFQLDAMIRGTAFWSMQAPHLEVQPGWIFWAVNAVLVGGSLLIWGLTRRVAPRRRIWARFYALTLLTLLCNPLGWMHYLLLPLVLMPGLFAVLPVRWAAWILGGTGALLSVPAFFWIADLGTPGDFLQVGVNVAVLLGLIVVVLAGARREAGC